MTTPQTTPFLTDANHFITRNGILTSQAQYVSEIHVMRMLRAKQFQECMRNCAQMNVKFAFPAKSFL